MFWLFVWWAYCLWWLGTYFDGLFYVSTCVRFFELVDFGFLAMLVILWVLVCCLLWLGLVRAWDCCLWIAVCVIYLNWSCGLLFAFVFVDGCSFVMRFVFIGVLALMHWFCFSVRLLGFTNVCFVTLTLRVAEFVVVAYCCVATIWCWWFGFVIYAVGLK